MAESDWITHREAAELLGDVHVSLIPKLIRRGHLTTRGVWPALSRAEVLELAAAREARAVERERQRASRRASSAPQPPDGEHEWLLTPAAAAVLGCSEGALQMRATRGRVPYTVHDGRRWFRLDLLELLVRARVAQEQMPSQALTHPGRR